MANLNKYSPNKTFSQTISLCLPSWQHKLSVRIKLISYQVFDCPLLFHQFLLLMFLLLLLLLFTFLEAKTTSCAENHSFAKCLTVHKDHDLKKITASEKQENIEWGICRTLTSLQRKLFVPNFYLLALA